MTEQLKSLAQRLHFARCEAWLESEDYYLAHRDETDYSPRESEKYKELVEREKILDTAYEQVKTALEVVAIVESQNEATEAVSA